ncbi:MAG: HYR domain-containing protein, partial [Deltaproteobacteria bacterium]|nr:HYR domain-containing protein [Deltaproteobacteria bacterium]
GIYGMTLAGNGGPGLTIRGPTTTGNSFSGSSGFSELPNQGPGVWIDNARGNTLGEVRIIGNQGPGIRVTGDLAEGNDLGGWSKHIRDNAGLGIDLVGGTEDAYGVTKNDPGDGDTGPNGLLNFPIVAAIQGVGDGVIRIYGLVCPSCTAYVYDAALDPSGYGEIKQYRAQAQADQYGVFQVEVFVGVPGPDTILTLQTRDTQGNVSELGAQVDVVEFILRPDRCGDGSKTSNEECDDANVASGDGCSAVCTIEGCGDGIIQAQLGEVCDTSCDDGNLCTVNDVCAIGCLGTCLPGAPRFCDDGDACTDNGCNPASGCTFTPKVCNDGSVCTTDACVPGVGCVFSPIDCDDGDACTADVCHPTLGCLHILEPRAGVVDDTCDTVDDDCNGEADEDFVRAPTTCGAGACASVGELRCVGGPVDDTCAEGAPLATSDATCDGVDDDCADGVDEDYAAVATTCGVGACAGNTGTTTCTLGDVDDDCDPYAGASPEACNAVDDDCDGATDEADEAGAGSVCGPLATTITQAPPALAASRAATFAFTNPLDPDADTFDCRLDDGDWVTCDGGTWSTDDLDDGAHTFSVRATRADGAVDPAPATHTWTIDATPPTTTILVGPDDPSDRASATFAVASDDASATFACALDPTSAPPAPEDWAPCAPSPTFVSLAEGAHALYVRATDGRGLTDATPATWSWSVDTIPLDTSLVTTPPALVDATTASFTFVASGAPDGATVGFECRLDGGAWSACDAGAVTYDALSEGAHSLLVRARVGDDVDPTPAFFDWRIDTSPPDTTLTLAPEDPSQSTSATFVLASDDPAATFRCALDPGPDHDLADLAPCAAVTTFDGLDEGPHTFVALAVDALGRADPTPVAHAWTIDTSFPDTAITSGPPDPTRASTATFTFTSPTDDDAGFACRLDAGDWQPCDAGAATFTGLAEGAHAFAVRAIDAAGRADPSPATRTWRVDLTAPAITIASAPPALSQSPDARFVVLVDEPATLACALDPAASPPPAEAYAPCDPIIERAELADGAHSLWLVATDAAGNTSAPTSYGWTIDTSTPETVITSGPPALTSPTHGAAFTFEDPDDDEATFDCQLDELAWAACDDGAVTYGASALALGPHSFRVRACSSAACDATPATWAWQVTSSPCPSDTTPPALTCVGPLTLACADGTATLAPEAVAPTTTDACGAPTVVIDIPDALALGTNPVVVMATDGNGNVASCVTPVDVVDDAPPTITCPDDLAVDSGDRMCGAVVAIDLRPATDACDGAPPVFSDAPAVFPLGKTTVTHRTVDRAGRTASCSFDVTVSDTTPLVLTCPEDLVVDAPADACAWRDTLEATASDNCTTEVAVVEEARSFPIGETVVTFDASDRSGNAASCTTRVTVRDVTPPRITCPASSDALPARFAATVEDACAATIELADLMCERVADDGTRTALASCPARVDADGVLVTDLASTDRLRVSWRVSATDPSDNGASETCSLEWTAPPRWDPELVGMGSGGCASGSAGDGLMVLAALLALAAIAFTRPRRSRVR